MTEQGLVSIGREYEEKLARLMEITGTSKDSDAVRTAIDMIVEDADLQNIRTVPKRAIGIKSKAGALMQGKATVTTG